MAVTEVFLARHVEKHSLITKFLHCLYSTAVLPKLELVCDSPGGLVKMWILISIQIEWPIFLISSLAMPLLSF